MIAGEKMGFECEGSSSVLIRSAQNSQVRILVFPFGNMAEWSKAIVSGTILRVIFTTGHTSSRSHIHAIQVNVVG